MTLYPWLEPTLTDWAGRRGRLHHAWLLAGMPGIGKARLARAMAGALLCETPDPAGLACGTCTGCHLFELGHHPDFRVLEPPPEEDEKGKRRQQIINIDQVRDLSDFIGLTAHRGGYRVVLAQPAEALNAAAANALLKTLEEPPANTVFLLVSHQPGRLLPTIKSRCCALPVPPPSREVAERWLREQGVKDARAALAYAGGAPLAALALLEDGQSEWLAEWGGALGRPAQLDPVQWSRRQEKTALAASWGVLSRWTHDLACVAAGAEPAYFPDAVPALRSLAAKVDPHALFAFNQRLLADQALLQHTLQIRLVLEQWLFAYRGLFRS